MPRWTLTVAGAVAFALLYAGMAIVFADVGIANVIFGSILAAGVGAMVSAVFAAGRGHRRQPRV